jgi:hypothetical protein
MVDDITYQDLLDLVDKYGVRLTGHYSENSSREEIKYEYILQTEYLHREKKIHYLMEQLKCMVYGLEMINEKYGPFDIDLVK